ncbi:MAG: exodeoxyribonuclease V subunit gamma [Coxiellaceae bacterium]|nr:exodeoxyribonuclease V subunit gamma [Coxiellaceae bacterium]
MDLNFLAELNDNQKQAVTFPMANLLVLAGAGSGKTKVLVYRIVWLLSQGIALRNILAVTFTNKAANEMRNRLEQKLQISLTDIWLGTFHGLAHRLLRLHWQEAGLCQDFQIMDDEDQLRLLKRVHQILNLDKEKWLPRQSQRFINRHKECGVRVNNLNPSDAVTHILINVYRLYEEMCRNSNLVDFAELLLRINELWRDNQQLRIHYHQKFQYILVDEFQDTNSMQYSWLKSLVGSTTSLTAVGDDDQSIYSWRGADSSNISRLRQDYLNIATVRLEQNYRSTANILGAANTIIACNHNRLGKNLWTDAGKGDRIVIHAAYNEISEAYYVVERIKSWINDGNSFSDIAILYRANFQSRVIEEQLLRCNIAYRIYGGMRFFERSEIKDVLAYLRLLINYNDDIAFERVVNLPVRGIGKSALAMFRDYAKLYNCSLWQAMKKIIATKKLPNKQINALYNFIQLLDDCREQITNLDLDALISWVIEHTGLRIHYTKLQYRDQQQLRLDNLDELITAATQFITTNHINKQLLLQNFLSQVILDSNEDVDNNSHVKLMTIHAAKGLEFSVVFLCGMEEGIFPHIMSTQKQEDLEEERRLCYVGITRARSKLYLLYANRRQVYGKCTLRLPSRFLREIPQNFITYDMLENKSRSVLLTDVTKFCLDQRIL